MMHVLIESGSRPRSRRSARWTFTSVAIHAAIVMLALVATSEATTSTAAEPIRADTIVYVVPRQETPRTPTTPNSVAGGGIVLPESPRITVPTDVALPAVPTVPTFDVGRAFDANTRAAVFGAGLGSGPVSHEGAPGVHTATTVDRAVLASADNPRPDYPRALRAAGVEGEVLVTFVVDSAGRVEPGSIRVVQATHEQFADAVRRWLPRTRYRPAEVGGRRVRQYVQQQVGFALDLER